MFGPAAVAQPVHLTARNLGPTTGIRSVADLEWRRQPGEGGLQCQRRQSFANCADLNTKRNGRGLLSAAAPALAAHSTGNPGRTARLFVGSAGRTYVTRGRV